MKTELTNISIDLTRQGEFRQFFQRFYAPLCVFADKYVVNEELAADIVQDCFLKLWEIRSDFFYIHQVKSFLYTSVRNRALNELEHAKVINEHADMILQKKEESFFHDHLIQQETYRLVREAINKLPTRTRSVIQLAMEGMTSNEIAEKLHVSGETVRTLKKAGYKKLRFFLKEHYYLLFLFLRF